MQVIRELGFEDITAIDPSPELQKGIDAGFIRSGEEFQGTLEEYIRSGGKQVDTAFIFNVSPDLLNSTQFINALMKIVKPGGIVVATCYESSTAAILRAATDASTHDNMGIIPIKESRRRKESEQREPIHDYGRSRPFLDKELNEYFFIGRRTNTIADYALVA